jgi:hypothetical protein
MVVACSTTMYLESHVTPHHPGTLPLSSASKQQVNQRARLVLYREQAASPFLTDVQGTTIGTTMMQGA